MDLEKFVRNFGFRNVRVREDRPYQYLDGYDSYSSSYYTRYDRSTIEMEIGRNELERMTEWFERMEKLNKEDHLEWELRRDNPALKEAYSKYKMLLALYK